MGLCNLIKNFGLRTLRKSILNAASTLMIDYLVVACKAGGPGEWEMLEMEEAICVVSEWEQHAKGGATTSAPSTKSMAQPKTIKAKAQAKREVRRQKLSINTVCFERKQRVKALAVFSMAKHTTFQSRGSAIKNLGFGKLKTMSLFLNMPGMKKHKKFLAIGSQWAQHIQRCDIAMFGEATFYSTNLCRKMRATIAHMETSLTPKDNEQASHWGEMHKGRTAERCYVKLSEQKIAKFKKEFWKQKLHQLIIHLKKNYQQWKLCILRRKGALALLQSTSNNYSLMWTLQLYLRN